MKINLKTIFISVFIVAMVSWSTFSKAQLLKPFKSQFPEQQLDDPVDPCDDPIFNPYCPIDSYLYLLLAFGIGYGIKKRIDARKSTVPAEE